MRFNRARYITLCQQSLVTAAVLAVGVSAAGVKTLDIVPQPAQAPDGAQAGSALGLTPGALAESRDRRTGDRAPVDTAPVTPKVREVPVRAVRPAPSGHDAPRANARGDRRRQAPQQVDGNPVVAESTPQAVTGYATVGVTWQHGVDYAEDGIAVQVRTASAGVWSGWQTVPYSDEHGADGAEGGEPGERPGTDALVIGDVDQVQMRAETADGSVPPDLQLSVIDPGTGHLTTSSPAIDTAAMDGGTSTSEPAIDTTRDDGTTDTVTLAASRSMNVAPKPKIYSRAQWGANEKIREQSKPSYGTIKTGFIHHTVNANNYSASDVPALLRGIYAYHVKSRGWRDIGYNFLVDRFGRIWEGRWGGVDRAVVGAHTLGYNEVSFAMSAIGNFEIARPPQAVIDAYAKLFAWKLSMYDIDASATRLWVKNRYLQAINGHRDVGQTACPGKYLYARIPDVRKAAAAIQRGAGSTPDPTPEPQPEPQPQPEPDNGAMTSPTQKPEAARAQPGKIDFPPYTNLIGSGYPDLLLRNSAGQVYIQPTGGQTALSGSTIRTRGPWQSMNLVAAVGDLTGNGESDLLGRIGRRTRIYAGTGDGHFATRGIGTTKKFRRADQIMRAGFWDGDKHSDVLVRTRSGNLWLVPGLGNGRFGKGTLLSRSWGQFTSTAVAGDLDRNGTPDVVAATGAGALYVVLTSTAGKLGTPHPAGSIGKGSELVGGGGDLTGDGVGDVFRRDPDGNFWILPGNGAGGLGAALGPFGRDHMVDPSAAPVTATSHVDLVGLNARRNKVLVVPSNGRTNLRPMVKTNVTMGRGKQLLSVGDWNGDGKGDLIKRLGGRGNDLVLHTGSGNGQFSAGTRMVRGWKSLKFLAAVGDVTGDGHPDLMGRTRRGPMTIFPGDGKDGFLRPQLAPKTMRTFNTVGTSGSWRTDGFPGTAMVSNGKAFVPLAGGTGGNPAGYDWVVGPGDVDGDGRADLVVRDSSGRLWLLPGTAEGYGPRRLIASGFGAWTKAG